MDLQAFCAYHCRGIHELLAWAVEYLTSILRVAPGIVPAPAFGIWNRLRWIRSPIWQGDFQGRTVTPCKRLLNFKLWPSPIDPRVCPLNDALFKPIHSWPPKILSSRCRCSTCIISRVGNLKVFSRASRYRSQGCFREMYLYNKIMGRSCKNCRRSIRRGSGVGLCTPCYHLPQIHAKLMRKWRRTHPLTIEQRRRDIARSYAGVYLRRGKIKRSPCSQCHEPGQHMHHEDYSRPLNIEWLCKRCHKRIHTIKLAS